MEIIYAIALHLLFELGYFPQITKITIQFLPLIVIRIVVIAETAVDA
jgi:hypothetical protein